MSPTGAEIECVARAICKSRSCLGHQCCEWPANMGLRHDCAVTKGGYADAARAAIAAMSLPSAVGVEGLVEALERIEQWSEAYPLDIFPEPTSTELKLAHEVLTPAGLTLDAISASAMRHVVVGVGRIAAGALAAFKSQGDKT